VKDCVLLLLLGGCVAPGRYTTQVTVRVGHCCSRTCETISTRSRVTVELAADRSASARWQRTGCRISESGPEAEALYLPGEPESVCGLTSVPGGHLTRYDGRAELRGHWRRSGRHARVDLGAWQLSCEPIQENHLPVLACYFEDPLSEASSAFGPRLLLGEGDGVTVCSLGAPHGGETRVERAGTVCRAQSR
jgi:hypothetical protein